MREGGHYTLRWPAHVQSLQNPTSPNFMANACEDDRFQYIGNMADVVAPADDRGYIELNSAQDIRQAIMFDAGTYDNPVIAGRSVNMHQGAGTTEGEAVAARVAQDTDSDHYAEYNADYEARQTDGNGRRVVTVPINNGPPRLRRCGFCGLLPLPNAR